jgi:hypothetical protein
LGFVVEEEGQGTVEREEGLGGERGLKKHGCVDKERDVGWRES